jgi:hypothetical protein
MAALVIFDVGMPDLQHCQDFMRAVKPEPTQ